jgi:hypothetical protein
LPRHPIKKWTGGRIGALPMSDTLVAYVISVVILTILALSVPCIELLAKLLRSANHDEEVRSANPRPIANSREVV